MRYRLKRYILKLLISIPEKLLKDITEYAFNVISFRAFYRKLRHFPPWWQARKYSLVFSVFSFQLSTYFKHSVFFFLKFNLPKMDQEEI